jgi:hypothetical protein
MKLALRWARGSGADSLSDNGVVAVTETYYGVGRRVGRRHPSWRRDLRAGVGDPLMAARMTWGGGVRCGVGIYALGRIAEERGQNRALHGCGCLHYCLKK